MRRVLNGLKNAAFFLLCYAQIPMMAGHLLLDNWIVLLMIHAALLPVSLLISLIPGRVGGRRRNDDSMVVRAARGNDPDPDRALRNEALPLPEKRAFPLRALICLIGTLGVLAGVFFMPVEAVANAHLLNRCAASLIMAAMLPLAVQVVAINSEHAASVTAGMILYVISGIAAYYLKDAALERCLLICGVSFLMMTGFAVNNMSMAKGASVRDGVRPPASMRRKNRVLLVGFGLVICLVLYFDRIRQVTIDAAQWLGIKLWELMLFLANLSGGEQSAVGGQGGGGGMDMGAMFGEAETGAFWKYSEQLIYVLAVFGIAALLFWLMTQFYRLFSSLIKKLIKHLKRITENIGEEYQDEQESLFDWGETKRELGDSLKKRLKSLTSREKKWEQMDARERVRYIVRMLYRKAPDSGNLRSLTVHEALKSVRTGQAKPEELAALYDMARYSQKEPDAQAAERIRKEAKV